MVRAERVFTAEARGVRHTRVNCVGAKSAVIGTEHVGRALRVSAVYTYIFASFGENKEHVVHTGLPAIRLLGTRDLVLDIAIQDRVARVVLVVHPRTGQHRVRWRSAVSLLIFVRDFVERAVAHILEEARKQPVVACGDIAPRLPEDRINMGSASHDRTAAITHILVSRLLSRGLQAQMRSGQWIVISPSMSGCARERCHGQRCANKHEESSRESQRCLSTEFHRKVSFHEKAPKEFLS